MQDATDILIDDHVDTVEPTIDRVKTFMTDSSEKIVKAARENPRTAIAAGVAGAAVVAGAIAAAAIPALRASKKTATRKPAARKTAAKPVAKRSTAKRTTAKAAS